MILHRKDFKQRNNFYSYNDGNYELCLEPCFNGYDIAIYDMDQNLLRKKICTDVYFSPPIYYMDSDKQINEAYYTAIDKALKIANKIYNEMYEKDIRC